MDNYLNLKNLSYSIPYGEEIISSIDLSVRKGEFIGILGKNGAGKTTLIDLILGNRTNYQGEINMLGVEPLKLSAEIKQGISFISQDISLKGNFIIREFLDFHALLFSLYNFEYEKELLEKFSIDDKSKLGTLSTGQQKKLQIISGLASIPKILIIDEITAVLDPEARQLFFEILSEHQKRYETAVVLATNIAEDLIETADRVLFIQNKIGKEYLPSEIRNLFNLEGAA